MNRETMEHFVTGTGKSCIVAGKELAGKSEYWSTAWYCHVNISML